MRNPRLGFFRGLFNSNLKQQIAKLEDENRQLLSRYNAVIALRADKCDEIEELKLQIKQLRAVLDTCSQVLSSAAKS
jgi:chromosome segregation ATPase